MIKQAAWALAFVCGATAMLSAAGLQADGKGAVPYASYEPAKSSVRILPDIKPAGLGDKPTEILSDKQLAKLLGDDAFVNVRGTVDFSREKLLWVTWAGSSSSFLTFDVLEIAGKTRVSVWIETPSPALADFRPHGALLVMPKDAAWDFGPGPILRIPRQAS